MQRLAPVGAGTGWGKDIERLRSFLTLVPEDTRAAIEFRSLSWADDEVRAWATRIREPAWDEAFVFFKHEDDGAGPKLAARFREILSG